MARFDVFETETGGYFLDCQANTLWQLNTRFCVPLMAPEEAPIAAAQLNPEFDVQGRRLRMVTQFAGAVYVRELGPCIVNLETEHAAIMNALDMLLTGY
jgi:toxin CcdB